uniref:Uncharacterized protein n=1 Tax=Arcella intermedia TaxID=1963864 RepID=A0A6B2LLA1_9EUKA
MVDKRKVVLSLWDTWAAHPENLRALVYPQTDVVLLCFSVVSQASLEHVKEIWWPEVTRHCGAALLVVGLKVDLREEKLELLREKGTEPVWPEQGDLLARDISALQYIECSALTGKSLKEVFHLALTTALSLPNHLPAKKAGGCSLL